jgi:hypothetical protein
MFSVESISGWCFENPGRGRSELTVKGRAVNEAGRGWEDKKAAWTLTHTLSHGTQGEG